MTTQHTPGPWHVSKPTRGKYRGDFAVGPAGSPERGPVFCYLAKGRDDIQAANAALIAAAPTMLKQLREAAKLLTYYCPRDKYPDGSIIQGPSETLRNLFATIALAEGRDPGEGIPDAQAAIAKAEGRS